MFELVMYICISVCDPAPPPHPMFQTEKECTAYAKLYHLVVANSVFEAHKHHKHPVGWGFYTHHECNRVTLS